MKKYFTLIPIIAVLLIILAGCRTNIGTGSITGTGPMVTRNIDVADFTALDISGSHVVTFRQAPESALTIVMQENLFEHLNTNVRNNTLSIYSRRNFETTNANRPRVYIYAPYLTALDISGAIAASDWDVIETQSFSIDMSGAASINIDLNVDHLEIDASGAASITLRGIANNLSIDGSGALNISAGDLQIQSGSVDISGTANVTLSTLENVNVTTSGLARVRAD